MGKSPGKWFKAVLFGKRSSKSDLSKGKQITKSTIEKAALVPNKEPASSFPVVPPVISEPLPFPVAGGRENPDSERGENARLPTVGLILSSPKQDGEEQTAIYLGLPGDSERLELEEAATLAQAAIKGYLARRSFRTLKGIIRLQAIIRGHLVRRQAVATLCCVQGIVKFQALVRGQMVRCSDLGMDVCSKFTLEKQGVKDLESCETDTYDQAEKLKNAFVGRLVSYSLTLMPLRLQYGPEEPNSAWSWLLRWTVSHVWEPQSERKKVISSNHQKVETGKARGKHSGRKLQSGNVENGSNHLTSASEKHKRKPRQVMDHAANSVQGHPPNEIEKVKSNLKKVSQSTKDASVLAEVDSEQLIRTQRKPVNPPAPELLEHGGDTPSDKRRTDTQEAILNATHLETCAELPATDGPLNELHDCPMSDSDKQLNNEEIGDEKNEDALTVDMDINSKDDQTGFVSHKVSKRRASLPAKHDDLETGLPSATKVPSYMATTQSAKAKVRGQVSPRFGQDAYERNGLTRRHSLPSSTNAKPSSSPRVQRLVQDSGKGAIKIDRSLSSSRDGKAIQAEWKR